MQTPQRRRRRLRNMRRSCIRSWRRNIPDGMIPFSKVCLFPQLQIRGTPYRSHEANLQAYKLMFKLLKPNAKTRLSAKRALKDKVCPRLMRSLFPVYWFKRFAHSVVQSGHSSLVSAQVLPYEYINGQVQGTPGPEVYGGHECWLRWPDALCAFLRTWRVPLMWTTSSLIRLSSIVQKDWCRESFAFQADHACDSCAFDNNDLFSLSIFISLLHFPRLDPIALHLYGSSGGGRRRSSSDNTSSHPSVQILVVIRN